MIVPDRVQDGHRCLGAGDWAHPDRPRSIPVASHTVCASPERRGERVHLQGTVIESTHIDVHRLTTLHPSKVRGVRVKMHGVSGSFSRADAHRGGRYYQLGAGLDTVNVDKQSVG